MTPKERVRLAMDLGVPDRIPVMCQMSIGHMLLQTGARPFEFWYDPDVFAGGLLALRARYGFDGILISLHGHSPRWENAVAGVEREEGGERVRWRDGTMTFHPFDDLPVPDLSRPRPVSAFREFDPDSLPAAAGYIPVSQGLRFPLDPEHLFDIHDALRRAAGDGFSLHGEVTSPLDYFLDLFGFEPALLGLVEDPGRAKAVLDRLTDAIVPLARGMAAHGMEAVKISSPYAGSGFLSPDFYERFVQPFEGRICRAVRAAGAHAYLHTCGDVSDRLELMAGSGASGIECLDPPPLGRTELAEAKARVGGRIFLKGNIDPVHTLLEGDPERIRQDARARVRAAGPGGYILSTACSIAPATPAANVAVLREVVEERAAA